MEPREPVVTECSLSCYYVKKSNEYIKPAEDPLSNLLIMLTPRPLCSSTYEPLYNCFHRQGKILIKIEHDMVNTIPFEL